MNADNLALQANTPEQAECQLNNLEQDVRGIGLNANPGKTEFMCFKQMVPSPPGNYISSSVDTQKRQGQQLTGHLQYRNLSDKIKREFFLTVTVSIQLYGCTI